MKIDTDKELEWDGEQFILFIITETKDQNGNPSGKFSRKKSYHSTLDQVARKISDLAVGKFIQSQCRDEIKPFTHAVQEALMPVCMRLKMARMVK